MEGLLDDERDLNDEINFDDESDLDDDEFDRLVELSYGGRPSADDGADESAKVTNDESPADDHDERRSSSQLPPRPDSPGDRKDSAVTPILRPPDKDNIRTFFEQNVEFNGKNKILLGKSIEADDKQTRYEFILMMTRYPQLRLRKNARKRKGNRHGPTSENLSFRLWKTLREIRDEFGLKTVQSFRAVRTAADFYQLPVPTSIRWPTDRQRVDIRLMMESGLDDPDCTSIESAKQEQKRKIEVIRDLNALQGGKARRR
ncbi:hypothetical protein CERZMDRAFT_101185 [Cercospora zeae-maydis SCOH1-5]|uniref:Uncharacterized protein n=1 Tax=Cercospora zeae-maydis SCOH1-5 TaxID=717836 RepID=A0A6A6F4L7_9PEZI|nr:hypothetical protein CERZMDRAFT_101185 [Cercospora zeae-maydis SCOH1-5]